MAYSTTNYSSWKFIYLILTLSLVLGYASSMRLSSATTMDSKEEEDFRLFSESSPKKYNEKKEFLMNNLFHMLPKGVPVPPSGPSPIGNNDDNHFSYP
ncbi:hypothetical protein EJD97_010665 [Solanum chilense]|uniref:Transmembrane protein n=1 Tax=Solanum chilense TaxID=4083 RepID=A0A6N2BMI6_SOLCI|nr:hypothetical protein EJD97_010665 [Solanum chilense]